MNRIHVLSALALLAPIVPLPPVQDPAPASVDARLEVAAALEDFLGAAAEADGRRYFSHIAEDAVLIGTDAAERWTRAELRTLLQPVFDAGQGRKSVPVETNVSLADDGNLAWFDQRLESERWGAMRGSGVLRRAEGRWEIVQYIWSFPVPNELVPELTARRRALGR